MTDSKITLEMDHDVEAAYIRLSDKQVAFTEELNQHVIVDLDEMRIVVGVEILGFQTRIPFSRLEKEYHVHSRVVEQLRQIQPSIQGFVSLTSGFDGSMSSARKDALVSA
ncbi:hypothetical protein GCM10012320_34950 [Sinomonas cellulolyticus]|uniref:DUF2283 domain-containing protein n=1 Tax=Sinomonas cellulolyticus TaxID=2801916 RepID=A0ABS1K586_9MICC|nr:MULTISPECIES: DUF2283 domain-containing protein [Sinomonas]MBL0706623.1 DUF2283 domain-containing protein [Sinomonas cellulolyticus]GHG60379.1 hypothetical protein GCM10012320_34950 [Sinomonas sp. KCTC 49339]